MGAESVNRRSVTRRCVVCDRGHTCFDIEAPKSASGKVGAQTTLPRDVVGSWHGEHIRFTSGTKVKIKRQFIDESGDLRLMIERISDGTTVWIAANLLHDVAEAE